MALNALFDDLLDNPTQFVPLPFSGIPANLDGDDLFCSEETDDEDCFDVGLSLLDEVEDQFMLDGFQGMADEDRIDRHELAKESRLEHSAKSSKKFLSQNLSKLLNLPTEVLSSIFDIIHPSDLLNVYRSSKLFRQLVKPTTWGASFTYYSTVPSKPHDISFVRWADFLFGTPYCEVCSSNDASIMFYLRRRLCISCRDKHCEWHDPETQGDFWDLLPHESRYYYLPDITVLKSLLSRYEKDAEAGDHYAQKRLQQCRDKSLADLLIRQEHADVCDVWKYGLLQRRDERNGAKLDRAIKRIHTRLVLAGHDRRDIENVYYPSYTMVEPFRTRRLFKKDIVRVYPAFEESVIDERERRIIRARSDCLAGRTSVIDGVLQEFEKEWVPSWKLGYTPCLASICRGFQPFRELAFRDDNESIEAEAFSSRIQELRNWIDEDWIPGKMRALACQLPHNHPCLDMSLPFPPEPDLNVLDLATAVFACPKSGVVLMGWDEAGEHLECFNTDGNTLAVDDAVVEPTLSLSGFRAAEELVRELNMNPDTTQAATLDLLDKRFLCGVCPVRMHDAHQLGKIAYNWRDAIVHALKIGHSSSSWDVLNEQDEQNVKVKEIAQGNDPADTDTAWYCAHCPFKYREECTKAEVFAHLRDDHHTLRRPVHLIDYGYVCKHDRSRRTPVVHRMEHPWKVEHDRAVANRKALLASTYIECYASLLTAYERMWMPPPEKEAIETFEAFDIFINQAGSYERGKKEWLSVVKGVATEEGDKRKEDFALKVYCNFLFIDEDDSDDSPEEKEGSDDGGADDLDLNLVGLLNELPFGDEVLDLTIIERATSVFRCSGEECSFVTQDGLKGMIGWADLEEHVVSGCTAEVELWEEQIDKVRMILKEAGLKRTSDVKKVDDTLGREWRRHIIGLEDST